MQNITYLNLIQTRQGFEFDVSENVQVPPMTIDGDKFIASYQIKGNAEAARSNVIQPLMARVDSLGISRPRKMVKFVARRLASYRVAA